jgi:hypothetical protein
MNIRRTLVGIAALSICVSSAHAVGASPAGSLQTGAYPVAANRIVGLWDTQVAAGPCDGGPTTFAGRGLNVFHAGGTLSATNNLPPTANGPTYGTWAYQGHGAYQAHMQFFRFLPGGSFDGVQDIQRTMSLSSDGQHTTETLYVRVLNPDDSLRTELCGTATADRIN